MGMIPCGIVGGVCRWKEEMWFITDILRDCRKSQFSDNIL